MLAELAAFTAAYKTVKGAVQAGRELVTVAQSIGTMVQSKDDLHRRLQKKKNSPFNSKVQTDLEEFLALEEIKQAEKDLEMMMVYVGRAGLKDDWLRYQAEARKQRKEAERRAQREREELIDTIITITSSFVGFLILAAGIYGLIWYFKG